ncbi:hypothetical protein GGR56DRAFT_557443 [Xylariaceae sp. FL0804]|nr:hypothetical protein GGR56DRAFT_557443 [Xylariaceae sp. FL0804]
MVPQPVPGTRGFDALPTRPPTPPREKSDNVDTKLLLPRSALNCPSASLHTPPSTSPHSTDSTNPTSRRRRKRVEFTTQDDYRDAPQYADKENAHRRSTPVAAPLSSTSSRPIKSILKQSSSPLPVNPLDPSAARDDSNRYANLAVMLESTVQQLAGPDRESRIDAYTMLGRALKVSNNLPDRIALQGKMGLFMQFIQRDITTKGPDGNVDSSLLKHALTLLAIFLHFPAIASTLSLEFSVFIMEHCIRSFEDPTMPKDAVRHLMQVVAEQDFPPKVMTSDRVARLVRSLHNIEEHLKGKSIIRARISIYHRLIQQSKLHMVVHSDWLLDLFTDMLSSMKEIRAAAIALGLDAAFTIGREKQLGRKVMEILQMTAEETRYIEYYVDRLKKMAEDKTESASVPQIWSVVILLLRCPIEHWEFLGRWLEIIQKCFNSGNHHTKIEANYAWNRLVYALQLNRSNISTKFMGTICQPFLSQLKRRTRAKREDELKKVVVGSVCNLYYYTLKPNSSFEQYNIYWDSCVRPLIQQMTFPDIDGKSTEKQASTLSENFTQAVLILSTLFDSSTPRLWKEDRIITTTLARPEELPALDPKWVRHNTHRVFDMIEPIFKKTFLELSQKDSNLHKLWSSLVGAVTSAASKEVKVSTDTTAFIGCTLSLLLKLWSAGTLQFTDEPEASEEFLAATETFLGIVVSSLGPLPFTEKLLSMNKQNTLVPVATPSHRSAKGTSLTPLYHLFSILSKLPPGISDSPRSAILIKNVFGPFASTRSSRTGRDLAQELTQALPIDTSFSSGAWIFLSRLMALSLENSQTSHSSTDSSNNSPIGHEYREIVKHLERGVKRTPNPPWFWEPWSTLLKVLVNRAIDEAGEAGCSIAVVEPLAKAIFEAEVEYTHDSHLMAFKSGIELVKLAKHPKDRQALDAARRRLWGTAVAGSRSASFDPFDYFYRLTNRLLEISYRGLDELSHEEVIAPLLTEVSCFLSKCSQLLVFKSLVNLQYGVCLWIHDADARFSDRQSPAVSESVKKLWTQICEILNGASLENIQLDAVEALLCSAFKSKHRYIVNTVTDMWNKAFEHVEEVEYPNSLKDVLLSLQAHVDITLPGLDVSSYQSNEKLHSFVESQDDQEPISVPSSTGRRSTRSTRSTPRELAFLSRRSATPDPVRLSLPKKRTFESTPDHRHPKSARRSGTPKLRHEDSQIQFAPIQSSSPANVESQNLTDRQREVRERQLENAALFPGIRSSPERAEMDMQGAQESPDLSSAPMLFPQARITTPTPQAGHEFDDYVASTPTPRRGQAPVIDYDHEMTDDVSSSPPEPRRKLLLEMKPRSRTTGIMENYPLSSSPVSGSPAPDQGRVEDVSGDGGPHLLTNAAPEKSAQDQSATRLSSPPILNEEPEVEAPATPTTARSLKKPETSKSDEEFVDALTSPKLQSPKARRSNTRMSSATKQAIGDNDASQAKRGSFEMSDGEESSLARLVVELDSRKCGPLPAYNLSSPMKPAEQEQSTAMDCITVYTGSEGDSGENSSPLGPRNLPSTEEVPVSRDQSKKKRKRSTGKKQGSMSKKQKHIEQHIITEDADEVLDSQDPQTTEAAPAVIVEDVSEISTSSSDSRSPDVDEEMVEEASFEELANADDSDGIEGYAEAADLQLITEASQQSEARRGVASREGSEEARCADSKAAAATPGVEAASESANREAVGEDQPTEEAELPPAPEAVSAGEEEAAPAKSVVEQLRALLRRASEVVRTATLSRAEVNDIEDLAMDFKRELYTAESRSRR